MDTFLGFLCFFMFIAFCIGTIVSLYCSVVYLPGEKKNDFLIAPRLRADFWDPTRQKWIFHWFWGFCLFQLLLEVFASWFHPFWWPVFSLILVLLIYFHRGFLVLLPMIMFFYFFPWGREFSLDEYLDNQNKERTKTSLIFAQKKKGIFEKYQFKFFYIDKEGDYQPFMSGSSWVFLRPRVHFLGDGKIVDIYWMGWFLPTRIIDEDIHQ